MFDATFHRNFTAGEYMPSPVMPDRRSAPAHWDHYIFKAPTVGELAKNIGIDPDKLQQVVTRMNGYERTGIDQEFGRRSADHGRIFGDPKLQPNPCLGPIKQAPFYAIPLRLGDLGTEGGLKADARARVLNHLGHTIPGLYAAGNVMGSLFGNCYPGAGGTIEPAMVFGSIAANDIAGQASARPKADASLQPAAVAAGQ